MTRIIYIITLVAIAMLGLGWSQATANHPVAVSMYCTTTEAIDELVEGLTDTYDTAYAVGKRLMEDPDLECFGYPGLAIPIQPIHITRWFEDFSGSEACVIMGVILADNTLVFVPSDGDKCWQAVHVEIPEGA